MYAFDTFQRKNFQRISFYYANIYNLNIQNCEMRGLGLGSFGPSLLEFCDKQQQLAVSTCG